MSVNNSWLERFNKRKELLAVQLGSNIGRNLTHEAVEYILREVDQANVYGFNEAVEHIKSKRK